MFDTLENNLLNKLKITEKENKDLKDQVKNLKENNIFLLNKHKNEHKTS